MGRRWRLPVARTSNAILPKKASAPLLSGMLPGALLGPMSGSVGASVLGLSRVLSPRLTAEGVPAATRDAIISRLPRPRRASAALAGAHPAQRRDAQRTHFCRDRNRRSRPRHQHAFHAALAPAIIFIILCLALAWRVGHGQPLPPGGRERLAPQEAILAGSALVFPAASARRRCRRTFLRSRSGRRRRLHHCAPASSPGGCITRSRR